MSNIDERKVVLIDYVNHRGERAVRRIQPEYLWWGVTAWHTTEGWLLHAYDLAKSAWRDFSWHGIVGPGDDPKSDILAMTRISDPEDERVRSIGRALRAMAFHEHLLRMGHPDLALDFIRMGLLDDDRPARRKR